MANKILSFFLIASLTVVHSIAFAEGDDKVEAKKEYVKLNSEEQDKVCAENYKKIGMSKDVMPDFVWLSYKDDKKSFESRLGDVFATTVGNVVVNTVGLVMFYPMKAYFNFRDKKYYLGMSDYILKKDTEDSSRLLSNLVSHIVYKFSVTAEEAIMQLDELRNNGFFCRTRSVAKLSKTGAAYIEAQGGWYYFNTSIRAANPDVVSEFYQDMNNFEYSFANVISERDLSEILDRIFSDRVKDH